MSLILWLDDFYCFLRRISGLDFPNIFILPMDFLWLGILNNIINLDILLFLWLPRNIWFMLLRLNLLLLFFFFVEACLLYSGRFRWSLVFNRGFLRRWLFRRGSNDCFLPWMFNIRVNLGISFLLRSKEWIRDRISIWIIELRMSLLFKIV